MLKKITVVVLLVIMAFSLLTPITTIQASEKEYIIYPQVQQISYQSGEYLLQDFKIEYGNSIDQYTKNRVNETLALKGLKSNPTSSSLFKIVTIDDDFDYSTYNIDKNWLQNHLDSYILISQNSNIIIVAKNTDSAFYGVTTLYHIFAQTEDLKIRNFRIDDYADIATRGYIEGYYGNPWSVQDRIELMKWSGYYKLNAYIYAPKDDPKHNSRWRQLYTTEELERIIKPQAQAGNESKNKFVYALHPYMHNPIRLGNSYEQDFKDLTAKFRQVIENGVRQIAVLADDAHFMGKDNYIKVLTDLTNWLRQEILPTYPDMSLIIPFCTQEYMGRGVDYYRNFPENVQIIMTGGRIWGTVNQEFGNAFKQNTARNVLYWINWPCSDNSKNHLIMGGFADFLKPGVDKNNIDGIVLNPMQQSEPSKVAIFGNAAYSWKIWENKQQADQAWHHSFAFVDHNNAIETESSIALRNLSKHMINQAMDGRVIALEESLEIKELLSNIISDLNNDIIDENKINSVKQIFINLSEDAQIYKNNAGNPRIKEQIIYWLNSWSDTSASAINYLDALTSLKNNDYSLAVELNNVAANYFKNSKSYGFHYVNHLEYAEVGVQHIVPFIKKLAEYTSSKVKTILDPNAITKRFITSRSDNPIGSTNNVFDNNESTFISYQDSNQLYFPIGTYVGVLFNKAIDIHNFEFLLGSGKNHFEQAKLEYTINGTDWHDLNLINMHNEFVGIRDKQQRIVINQENLNPNFKAMGLRLITTRANTLDAYLNVHEIRVNHQITIEDQIIEGEYSTNRELMGGKTDFNSLKDNNPQTEVWLSNRNGPYRDQLQANSYIQLQFKQPTYVKDIYFSQGATNNGDILDQGVLEYFKDETWHQIGKVDKILKKVFNVSGLNIETDKLRIRNIKDKAIWWRLGDFYATTGVKDSNIPIRYDVIKSDLWSNYNSQDSLLYDGDDNSFVWYDPDGSGNSHSDNVMVGDFLGYDLGKIATLNKLHIVVGAGDGDKLQRYAIQYSLDGIDWENVPGYDNYQGKASGKDILDINVNGLKARYLRIYNLAQHPAWVKFSEFSVVEQAVGSLDYSFGNIDPALETINSNDNGTLRFIKNAINLDKDQYVGFKLKHIEEILKIVLPNDLENIKVQVAKHPELFEDYDSTKLPLDARYIRFLSTKDNTTLDLNQIEATYKVIHKPSISSNFANNNNARDVRTKNNLGHVFDGDLSSSIILTGPQLLNNEVLFDLGHIVPINSLRYYINENSLDFPRSMDVLISESVDGPYQKIMHIGPEQVSNSSNSLTAKSYQDNNYLLHDSNNPGNMYAEARDLNSRARYIKFKITAAYNHRWLEINEIVLNDGEYISIEPHKDIVSTIVEEKNHYPSLALDNNYDTYYLLSKAGEFTYRISQNDQHSIRMVQLGSPSFAQINAIILEDSQIKEKTLGILNQTINEFSLPSNQKLIEVKIKFNDVISNIVEITTSRKTQESVNKVELENYLLQAVDYDNWIESSKVEYNRAKKVAREVLDNPYATQSNIDLALASLKAVINRAQIKGDISILENDILEKLSLMDDDIMIYSPVSFNKYLSVVKKIEVLIKNKDNATESMINTLHQSLLDAKNQLKFSKLEHDKAKILLNNELELLANDYTINSYNKYQSAKQNLETGLVTVENPKQLLPLVVAFKDSKKELVNVKELKSLLNRDIVESLYTNDSYLAYKNLIDNQVNKVLQSGTSEEVAEMINLLKTTLVFIDYNAEITRLSNLASGDYTKASYQEFINALNKAKQLVNNPDTLNEGIALLRNLESKLVSIVTLKIQKEKIANLNINNYIPDSRQKITSNLNKIGQLIENGNQEEISKFINESNAMLTQLVINSLSKQSEWDSVVLIDNNDKTYKEEEYAIYKQAYDEYKGLNLGDISLDEYAIVWSKLEAAKTNLVKLFKLVVKDNINVTVEQSDYYAGKKLVINLVNDNSIVEEFKQILAPGSKILIYDIKLLDNQSIIQPDPTHPITIKFKLNSEQLLAKDSLQLWHIDNGNKELVTFKIENDYLVFEASHFSYYVITYKPVTTNISNSNEILSTNQPTLTLPNTGSTLMTMSKYSFIISCLGIVCLFKRKK